MRSIALAILALSSVACGGGGGVGPDAGSVDGGTVTARPDGGASRPDGGGDPRLFAPETLSLRTYALNVLLDGDGVIFVTPTKLMRAPRAGGDTTTIGELPSTLIVRGLWADEEAVFVAGLDCQTPAGRACVRLLRYPRGGGGPTTLVDRPGAFIGDFVAVAPFGARHLALPLGAAEELLRVDRWSGDAVVLGQRGAVHSMVSTADSLWYVMFTGGSTRLLRRPFGAPVDSPSVDLGATGGYDVTLFAARDTIYTVTHSRAGTVLAAIEPARGTATPIATFSPERSATLAQASVGVARAALGFANGHGAVVVALPSGEVLGDYPDIDMVHAAGDEDGLCYEGTAGLHCGRLAR